MIELIKNPSKWLMDELISNSAKSIKMCVPYIKTSIIKDILMHKPSKVKLELITTSNLASFASGGSDICAIKQLINEGVKVYNYQGLHAKIYVFDDERAIITSANLTYNGLYKNYEYGVYVNEDKETMNKIVSDFDNMLLSEMCGVFKIIDIDFIEKTIKNFGEKINTRFDNDGDNYILDVAKNGITKSLSTWQDDIFNLIDKFENEYFSLEYMYSFEQTLIKKHPKNYHIKEKIRQILQQLRDRGLIKFITPGNYKKLWR